MVYVRLPDTTTRGIPSWMMDEAVCDGMSVTSRPVIAPQALRALADLLDQNAATPGKKPDALPAVSSSSAIPVTACPVQPSGVCGGAVSGGNDATRGGTGNAGGSPCGLPAAAGGPAAGSYQSGEWKGGLSA